MRERFAPLASYLTDGLGVTCVYKPVASGCIRVGDGEFAGRLNQIFNRVGELVAEYAPEVVAIERVFMHRNADSALKLGQARAAAMLAAAARTVPVFEYSPNEIKQSVTGKGHAEKQQIQHMIRVLLCLSEHPQSDRADALAVALTHGHTRQTLSRMNSTGSAS